MSKAIVALGAGIIIGAAGMWFFGKSTEKQLQVDEVIESYSAPMTTDGNAAPAPAPTDHGQGTPTTGSLNNEINLSDASGSMDSSNMGNDMNNMDMNKTNPENMNPNANTDVNNQNGTMGNTNNMGTPANNGQAQQPANQGY